MIVSNQSRSLLGLTHSRFENQGRPRNSFQQYLLITRLRRIGLLFFFPLLGAILFSCAPNIKYYQELNNRLRNQAFDSAHQLVRENKKTYPGRNAVLYYLDEGIVAHFASRYEESNQSLSHAEAIIEELYTRSLTRQAASFLINDNTVPYRGEDFESALVNLFMALNYVGMGQWEDALVESRKIDDKLNIINSQYEEGKKNVYKEDAFIRFLMGALYEAEGEINDAFISYRKAEEIYRTNYLPNFGVSPPPFLIENLLTAAQALGFQDEIDEIQGKYPDAVFMDPAEKKDMAEVYIIFYNGLGPEKVEAHFLVPMPDRYVIKIAYPKFEKKTFRIAGSKIMLKNLESGRSFRSSTLLMEDIASIAVTNLKNRIFRIKAKAIARATAKYIATAAAAREANKHGGSLAGFLVQASGQAFGLLTEQADIRHWRLLPAEIRVGRMIIPSGKYEGEIRFVNSAGFAFSSRKISSFTVEKGEKKFLLFRTLN